MAAALTIVESQVQPTATTQTSVFTAGATLTAGQAFYLDAADGSSAKPADADTLATCVVAGIAMTGADDGQKFVGATGGDINPGGTLVVGEWYYLHATAGGIGVRGDLVAGDFLTSIGYATAAGNLKLAIVASGVALAA